MLGRIGALAAVPVAAVARQDYVKKEKPPQINNTDLVKAFREVQGGGILHIRPQGTRRGMTFAYVVRGSRIEIATSIQHRADTFTKKVGTRLAIQHFNEGKTVFLPISNKQKATYFLEDIASCSR